MSQPSDDLIYILHVDDDEEISSLTTTFLERENDRFETETLTDPVGAVDRLGDGGIDCIVSDYEMPEMDGLTFLRAVREDHPHLPFILFTGKGSEEVASKAISAGVTDYLQKGSGSEQYQLLANRIANAVSQHRSEQLARKQERVLSLLQRLNQGMVTATTSNEIEDEVTSILSSDDPYTLAWIGKYDAERDRVVPQTVSGEGADAVSPKRLSKEGERIEGVIRDVIQSGEITVVNRGDPTVEVWDDATSIDYDGAIVVPIMYHDDWEGLMVVYAETASIFEDVELEMFEELSGDLGQALHTAKTHRTLKRHRSAVEAIPEGVLVLDEHATIELANESAASLIGRKPAEIQGAPFPDFVDKGIVDPEVVDWYVETLRELLTSSSDKQEAWYETEIHPVDEQPRTVEIHITLRPYDEEFRGTVGIVRDITDRKERQRELEASKERYRRLVEEAPVPIAMYDRSGTLVYVNDSAVEFMDASEPENLLGRSALEFTHPESREKATQRIQRVLEEREAAPETELTLLDCSGTQKYVHITGVPVTYEGEPAGQIVIRDITEQKEREKDLERQRDQLDEFASIVSHDLRNPLEVLRGRLELLEAEFDSPHIEAASRAHGRMETLLEDLLRFARIDERALDREPIDLEEIAQDAWLNVESGEGSLIIESNHELNGDPSRVKELFENLFRNGKEHGGSAVKITVGQLPNESGFYVADDGPGVPEDDRSRVFEYGYSTDSEGTGLGLAIVSQVAEIHGWDICLTESEDGGARFEFYEGTK